MCEKCVRKVDTETRREKVMKTQKKSQAALFHTHTRLFSHPRAPHTHTFHTLFMHISRVARTLSRLPSAFTSAWRCLTESYSRTSRPLQGGGSAPPHRGECPDDPAPHGHAPPTTRLPPCRRRLESTQKPRPPQQWGGRANTKPPPPVTELGFECWRTMSDPVPPLPTVFKSGGRDFESYVVRLSCGECVMSLSSRPR